MKRFLRSVAILGLIALVSSCSGGGAKKPSVPTPSNNSWSIALSLSSTQGLVNQVLTATATVQQNGSAAPDGTTVEFVISPGLATDSGTGLQTGGVFSNGASTANVATSGGRAVVAFTGISAATYIIQARVGDQYSQQSAVIREPDTPTSMQLLSITPSIGAQSGGEQAVITAIGVVTPIEVFFDVTQTDGFSGTFQAQVISVMASGADAEGSDPSQAVNAITIITPTLTGIDETLEALSDVRVAAGIGTTNEQEHTLPGAFRFQAASGEPEVYALIPSSGNAAGGEQVTVLGRNFSSPVSVRFGDLEADELVVSGDGTQISVLTPQYSAVGLAEDTPVAVTVINEEGTVREVTVTKANAFVYLADEPQPSINAVSPSAGPLDGGTRVTIFGNGFDFPVQVFFGTLEAQVISVDRRQIICLTPDYSAVPDITPPVTVNVEVVNVDSGLRAEGEEMFTYAEQLFISGNTPTEGALGTLVTIYGSGFIDPLIVDLGLTRLEVIAVSGNELVVRIPTDLPPSCGGTTGQFTVTLIDSNLSASGGTFEILGNQPTVLSVEPLTFESLSAGDNVTPTTATINGLRFLPDFTVTFDAYILPATDVQYVDDETINVLNVPAPNDFGLVFDRASCWTGGLQGFRDVATEVSVTVTNYPGACADTLEGALIYEPEDTTCEVAPGISVEPESVTFTGTCAFTDGSNCSGSPQTLTVTNIGGGDVSWNAVTPTDFSLTATSGGPLAEGASGFTDVDFCPTAVGGLSGTISFTTAPAGTGDSVSTLGTGLAAASMAISPPTLSFGATGTDTITIDNTLGTADLDIVAEINLGAGSTEFQLTLFDGSPYTAGTTVTVAAGATATLTVSYTDNGGAPYLGDTVDITPTNTGNAACDSLVGPASVPLTGN
jgi:hypothetical protein